ncbi:MAG: hypothetical protein WAU27_00420 [Pseudomonadales bacterium]
MQRRLVTIFGLLAQLLLRCIAHAGALQRWPLIERIDFEGEYAVIRMAAGDQADRFVERAVERRAADLPQQVPNVRLAPEIGFELDLGNFAGREVFAIRFVRDVAATVKAERRLGNCGLQHAGRNALIETQRLLWRFTRGCNERQQPQQQNQPWSGDGDRWPSTTTNQERWRHTARVPAGEIMATPSRVAMTCCIVPVHGKALICDVRIAAKQPIDSDSVDNQLLRRA